MATAAKPKKPSSGGGKSKSNKSPLKRIGKIIAKCIMWFFILSIFLVVLFRFVPVYYTPLMFIRVAEQVYDGKPLKMEHKWVPIEKINKNMVNAVVASEDNLFMEHHGFDFNGIIKAYEHNQHRKKKIHGGSTISQQTAKNVFLFPSRTYFRKGLEAYFTVLIELVWSKERIMEVYLNVIEMGDGIYGIEKASQTYYDKPASKLTKAQAASITMCLPNPRKYSPLKNTPFYQSRRDRILETMAQLGDVKLTKKND